MDPTPAWSIAQRDECREYFTEETVAMRMGLAGLLGVVLVALYVWRGSWPVC
jgi:hypothetical protein